MPKVCSHDGYLYILMCLAGLRQAIDLFSRAVQEALRACDMQAAEQTGRCGSIFKTS